MAKNEFRNKPDDELASDGQTGMTGTGDSIEMMRRLKCAIQEQTAVMKKLSKTGTILTIVAVLVAILIGLLTWWSATRAPDVKDPQQVVKAFLKAVIAGDYERASAFCEDKQWFRERGIKEFKRLENGKLFDGGKKVPPLPKHPQITVTTDGNTGLATIENWEYKDGGIDLVFRGGRWWIKQ